jgi:ribonuclease G
MSFKNVGEELSRALKRTVKLKSGGYIVIDETEALTAIDVNTGKYTGDLSLESTVFNTNMEAAEEIGKQIRLRDIGGIIVIDFIDMRNKKDINLVMEKMKEVLKKDRTKTNLYGITNLGLVEMTRKKARNTLSSKLTSICPMCGGRGRI